MMFGAGGPPPEAVPEPAGSRLDFLAIPAMALAGGGLSSFNPPIAAILLVAAAVGTLFLFGVGILPLVVAGVLGVAAYLVYVEV